LLGGLGFRDVLRPDAADTVAALQARGLRVFLLSGDDNATVQVGWAAGCHMRMRNGRGSAVRGIWLLAVHSKAAAQSVLVQSPNNWHLSSLPQHTHQWVMPLLLWRTCPRVSYTTPPIHTRPPCSAHWITQAMAAAAGIPSADAYGSNTPHHKLEFIRHSQFCLAPQQLLASVSAFLNMTYAHLPPPALYPAPPPRSHRLWLQRQAFPLLTRTAATPPSRSLKSSGGCRGRA
jgi:hypothetical protein